VYSVYVVYQVRLRGQITKSSACKRGMILEYSVIQPLRVAPSISSPTGSVGGVGCRLYACIEPVHARMACSLGR
jgi:hypothetical protein